MREINFFKYQGTGNDFILINQMASVYELTNEQIAFVCNRRFGIGADGLMIIRKHKDYDFEMVYYNSDGKPGSMCGNGGRCIVKFAYDEGFIGNSTRFLAVDGPHTADLNGDLVTLGMSDVKEINFLEEGRTYELNTGSPHYVTIVDQKENLDVIKTLGRKIRYNKTYAKNGINVNMLYQEDSDTIFVATYERGVEDETLSCGTGVTACAIVTGIHYPAMSSVDVITKGGALNVQFDREGSSFTNVKLTGPALRVFTGSILI